jgi:RibD domain-containing protein
VVGRRHFDHAGGWGGRHPMDLPVFVVTHAVPQEWVYEGSPFAFVMDGLESALEKAKAAAGDKDVAVGAASIVQQCIRAGLLDEIHVDLVPVLLGGRRQIVRPPGHGADRAGEPPGDRGRWGHASYLPRREVKYQPDQGFLDVGTFVIYCWPPGRGC